MNKADDYYYEYFVVRLLPGAPMPYLLLRLKHSSRGIWQEHWQRPIHNLEEFLTKSQRMGFQLLHLGGEPGIVITLI